MGQQPVLDDHSTHYSTDAAAADPSGKKTRSLSRAATRLVRLFFGFSHLIFLPSPAARGGCAMWKLTKLKFLHLRKIPQNDIVRNSSDKISEQTDM